MLYPIPPLTPAFPLHQRTGTTRAQERLQQHKRGSLHPLRIFTSFLSLSLSACAVQSTPSTLSVANVHTAQRPPTQEPTPAIATKTASGTVLTAADIFTRGQKALEAGRYEHAVNLLSQAIQLDATNALYYLWLGRAYGYQAEHTKAGEQFFLARQVRKNLEKAVTLNPDLIEARFDLLTYYLQAPSLLGGGIEKAQAQAVEITKRDPQQGALAWQQCQRAEKEEGSLLAVSQ